VLVDVLVALVRRPDVRERRQEWQVVGIDAVADHVVRGVVRHAEDRVEGGAVTLEEGADLDVGDVVEETTAVGAQRATARLESIGPTSPTNRASVSSSNGAGMSR
jgi:hypothetical protein